MGCPAGWFTSPVQVQGHCYSEIILSCLESYHIFPQGRCLLCSVLVRHPPNTTQLGSMENSIKSPLPHMRFTKPNYLQYLERLCSCSQPGKRYLETWFWALMYCVLANLTSVCMLACLVTELLTLLQLLFPRTFYQLPAALTYFSVLAPLSKFLNWLWAATPWKGSQNIMFDQGNSVSKCILKWWVNLYLGATLFQQHHWNWFSWTLHQPNSM